MEIVEVEERLEQAKINGCIAVCEETEARDRSDIQSCVHRVEVDLRVLASSLARRQC